MMAGEIAAINIAADKHRFTLSWWGRHFCRPWRGQIIDVGEYCLPIPSARLRKVSPFLRIQLQALDSARKMGKTFCAIVWDYHVAKFLPPNLRQCGIWKHC